jgi:hypothetical protein
LDFDDNADTNTKLDKKDQVNKNIFPVSGVEGIFDTTGKINELNLKKALAGITKNIVENVEN